MLSIYIYMSIYVSVFLTYILPTMQLWINVIQFWTSIVSIHNWMTVLSLLLLSFLLLSSLSFSWCFIFMNAPGLRDPVVMWALSNFYRMSTSSIHVSVGMAFLGLGIRGMSHQSCMSLCIGTDNIIGGSINFALFYCVVILSVINAFMRFIYPNYWRTSRLHYCHHTGEVILKDIQLTHWGRDKMDVISQTTFSNAFSWMKMYYFQLKFHWSLFLWVQLTIFQHWFR